jgi:hypothetical protein
MRKRVRELASNVVSKPLSYVASMPQAAVPALLRDAVMKAVDMAVEEVMNWRTTGGGGVGENGNVRSSSSSSDGVLQSALSPSIAHEARSHLYLLCERNTGKSSPRGFGILVKKAAPVNQILR